MSIRIKYSITDLVRSAHWSDGQCTNEPKTVSYDLWLKIPTAAKHVCVYFSVCFQMPTSPVWIQQVYGSSESHLQR